MASVQAVIEALEEANRRKILHVSQTTSSGPEPKLPPASDFDLLSTTEPRLSENKALVENAEIPLDHFKKIIIDKSRIRRPTHKKFVGQDVSPSLLAPETSHTTSPSLSPSPATLPPVDPDFPLNLGDILRVNTAAGEQTGIIRFLGPTFFANPELATGEWIGLELETPDGKNDGSVKGSRYFTCEPLHGIFVQRRVVIANLGPERSSLLPGEIPQQVIETQEAPKTPNRNWPWVKIKPEGSNDSYYWNEETDVTTWLRPESFFEDEVDPTPSLSPIGLEAALIQEAMAQVADLPLAENPSPNQAAIDWAEQEAERVLTDHSKIQLEQARAAKTQEQAQQEVHQGAPATDAVRSPWTAVDSGDGSFYYWNEDTDETTWEKPADFESPRAELAREKDEAAIAQNVTAVQHADEQATEPAAAEKATHEQAAYENAAAEQAAIARAEADKAVIARAEEEKATLAKAEAEQAAFTIEKGHLDATSATEEPAEEEEAWAAVENPDGTVYYWNRETDETTWVMPEEFGQKKKDVPVAIKIHSDPTVTSNAVNRQAEEPESENASDRNQHVPAGWQQIKEDSSDLESDEDVAANRAHKRKGTTIATSITPAVVAAPPVSAPNAPPPAAKSPWRATQTEDGKVYYWHRVTGVTTWTQPPDYLEGNDSSDLDSDEEKTNSERSNVTQPIQGLSVTGVAGEAEAEMLKTIATRGAAEQTAFEEVIRAAEQEEELAEQTAAKETVALKAAIGEPLEKLIRNNVEIEAALMAPKEAPTSLPQSHEVIVAEAARDLGPWLETRDDSGRVYYWNEDTDETTWEKPAQLVDLETRSKIAEEAMRKVEVSQSERAVFQENPFEMIAVEVREPTIIQEEQAKRAEAEQELTLERENLERLQRLQLEIEQAAREKLAKEEFERENFEKEALERDRLETEKLEREKREREQKEQEQFGIKKPEDKSTTGFPSNGSSKNDGTKVLDSQDNGLGRDLIPLSNFVDHWLLTESMLGQKLPEEVEGPVHALRAALSLLKDLWFLEDQTWARVKHRVKIGIVKDTKLYGNTSVSMGAAKLFGRRGGSVGFLNCGTGGIKYQLYSWMGALRLSAEFKPKNGASPQALQLGAYKPKAPLSFEATRELLLGELAHEELPWVRSQVPVFAFVTGTIRNYWEEADSSERAVLEGGMQSLFQDTGVRCLNDSFFLSSEEEGRLELLGCNAMYANLVGAGLLEDGTEVIGSLGIGRGSCQWAIASPKGQVETIGHASGMADPQGLAGLSRAVTSVYRQPSKLYSLLDSITNAEHPVIALKSGCCLLLEKKEYSHLKSLLTAPDPQTLRRARIAQNGSRRVPEEFTWLGALDRLCAEAACQLKLSGDFPVVYDEGGSVLTSVDGLPSSPLPLLILAARGESFVHVVRDQLSDHPFIEAPRRAKPTRGSPPLPLWSDDIPRKFGLFSTQKLGPLPAVSALSTAFLSASLPCPACHCMPSDATPSL